MFSTLALSIALAVTGATAMPVRAAEQVPGVQIHPLWAAADAEDARKDLDDAARAGAGMVRVDVGWASLEQEAKGKREKWYLDRLDAVVDGARERGLQVLLTFMSSPCWASSAPEAERDGCSGSWWERGVQHYAPTDPADYADALAFLVERYGSRVAAWEVWNEPNQDAFFKAPDQAAAYAALLRAAYPAAKAADPRATVVGGSLAEADHKFTERLYENGVKGHFDAWAIHPYAGDKSPLNPGDDDYLAASFVRGVPAVRAVMLRNGDDKPLWLTEFGWSTTTTRGGEQWENGVTPQQQARHLEQAFDQLRRWDYVDVGIWFNLRDTSADPADRVGNYGLIEDDGSDKPAFAAFRSAAARFRPPSTTPGGQPPQDQAAAPRLEPPTLALSRSGTDVIAHGAAPAGATLRIVAKRRGRPAVRRTVRTTRRGRYRTRLARGRAARSSWQVTVTVRCTPACPHTPRATARLRPRGRR